MRNIHALDRDRNGSVSFLELANFLIQKHCGELSLQREHKKGMMSKGVQRIMTFEEFKKLMNAAYQFLGVTIPENVAATIF
jgi:hypothetical protein